MAHCVSNFQDLLSCWPLNLSFTLLFFPVSTAINNYSFSNCMVKSISSLLCYFASYYIYRKLNKRCYRNDYERRCSYAQISFIKIRRPLKRQSKFTLKNVSYVKKKKILRSWPSSSVDYCPDTSRLWVRSLVRSYTRISRWMCGITNQCFLSLALLSLSCQ